MEIWEGELLTGGDKTWRQPQGWLMCNSCAAFALRQVFLPDSGGGVQAEGCITRKRGSERWYCWQRVCAQCNSAQQQHQQTLGSRLHTLTGCSQNKSDNHAMAHLCL